MTGFRPSFDPGVATDPRVLDGYHAVPTRSPVNLASIPMACLLLGQHGRILDVNQIGLDLSGYTRQDLVGLPIEKLLPDPASHQHLLPRVASPEPTIPLIDCELRVRRKDGSEIPVALGLQPLQVGSGFQVVVIILDLSEVKRAEAHLRQFFELSLDLLCIASLDGYFLRVNPSFTRVLGYWPEELLARPFLEFVHPEDEESTLGEVAKLAAGSPTVRFRNRFRSNKGQYHWFEWNAVSIPRERLIFAVARDITDQIVMEQLMLTNERRERAILDNTSALISVKNARGHYEFINQTFSRLLSVDRGDALGRSDAELFPQSLAEALGRKDRQVLETGVSIQFQETLPLEDGSHTFVSVKVPLCNADGRVTAVAGISTDISEQLRAKRVDEEMKLAQIVQQRLYPAKFPPLAGYDFAGSSLPMTRLCGDYYDYLMPQARQLLLAVGDVSGHGLGPALTMVEVRALLRVLLMQNQDLSAVVGQVNRELMRDDLDAFITLIIVQLDLDRRTIRYLGAGHDAWLLRADGTRDRLESTSMPLGIADGEFSICTLERPCEPGDVLLMFTDGLTECASPQGKLLGTERMLETVAAAMHQSATTIVERLFSVVRDHTGGLPLQDDITMIVARVLP